MKRNVENLWKFGKFLSSFPHLNFEVAEFVKYKVYSSFSIALDFIWNVHFHYHKFFKKDIFQTLECFDLLFMFEKDKNFYYYFPFKGFDIESFFEKLTRRLFPRGFILNFFPQTFERTLLNWNFKFL